MYRMHVMYVMYRMYVINVCMYVCMHVDMYACIFTYVHVYVHMHVHMQTIYVCTCIHIYIWYPPGTPRPFMMPSLSVPPLGPGSERFQH